jgi:hypothetical protein
MALDATRLKNAIKSALDARFGALSGADNTNREGFCEDLATEIVTEVEDNFEGGSGGGVPTSRQVIAGNGLTGGGALSGDVTLDVVAGDTTLTVAANSVVVNTSVVATRAYADSGDAATLASAQTYADSAADAAESAANAYTDAEIATLQTSIDAKVQELLFGASSISTTSGANNYLNPGAASAAGGGNSNIGRRWYFTRAATIRNVYVLISSGSASQIVHYIVEKGTGTGAPATQEITVVVGAGVTTGEDYSDSFTVAKGDFITVKAVPQAGLASGVFVVYVHLEVHY